MRLLRSSETRFSSYDDVFRQSWKTSALVATILYAAAGAVFCWSAFFGAPGIFAVLCGGGLMLIGLVAVTAARRARRPTNWLMACDDRRVLLKLSSYLNDEDPAMYDVAELLLAEIAGVRAVEVTTIGVRAQEKSRSRSLELVLRPDVNLDPVRTALSNARANPKAGVRFLDQPIGVTREGTILVEWSSPSSQITPALSLALSRLGHHCAVLPDESRRFDFGQVGKSATVADAEEQLRLMAQRGHIIRAAKMGMRVLGWSATEAQRFADAQRGAAGLASTEPMRAANVRDGD